jgi:hypothetical protein
MRAHDHDRVKPEPARPARRPEQPLHDVLALQRSAGNQAVSAMLSRQPTQTEAAATATVSKLGVIPLLSFSTQHRQGRGESTGGIVCVSNVGAHSAKLQQLMTAGEVVDVEIVAGKSGHKLKLERAIISSYSTGDAEGVPTETWTIEPGKTSYDDGKGGGGGNDRSVWDDPQPG